MLVRYQVLFDTDRYLNVVAPHNISWVWYRALCRIQLLPVTHVLVDTWMLTVKPVDKLLKVSDDLSWTTNTHVTPFHSLSRQLTISMVLEDPFLFYFLLLHFFTRPPPVHPYFYPSIFVFTHPNDGWSGLYTKLWCSIIAATSDHK